VAETPLPTALELVRLVELASCLTFKLKLPIAASALAVAVTKAGVVDGVSVAADLPLMFVRSVSCCSAFCSELTLFLMAIQPFLRISSLAFCRCSACRGWRSTAMSWLMMLPV
jgi:hypothetical protein